MAALGIANEIINSERINMSGFIGTAHAASSAGGQESIWPTIVMVAVFLVFMFFVIIRPQMKRQKEQRQLLESLDKGAEIVTSGGMAGKIRELGENFLTVEISRDVHIQVQKSSVTRVLPKGTLGTL